MSRQQRSRTRYGLELPIAFTWAVGSERLKGSGCTRDISLAGSYIVSPETPEVGATVKFEVMLPSLLSLDRALKLQGTGRVVRVENSAKEGPQGFALVNSAFSLTEPTEEQNAVGLGAAQS